MRGRRGIATHTCVTLIDTVGLPGQGVLASTPSAIAPVASYIQLQLSSQSSGGPVSLAAALRWLTEDTIRGMPHLGTVPTHLLLTGLATAKQQLATGAPITPPSGTVQEVCLFEGTTG